MASRAAIGPRTPQCPLMFYTTFLSLQRLWVEGLSVSNTSGDLRLVFQNLPKSYIQAPIKDFYVPRIHSRPNFQDLGKQNVRGPRIIFGTKKFFSTILGQSRTPYEPRGIGNRFFFELHLITNLVPDRLIQSDREAITRRCPGGEPRSYNTMF